MSDTERIDSGPAVELSIVMPCLNEAETLETCLVKAQAFLRENGVSGEVIVSDNGSTDGSLDIAEKCGARIVHASERGYGAALRAGIAEARGEFVIMGDADDSYDFLRLGGFLEQLRAGYDLVMGNRFKGGVAPGAMPPLHKYLGNPVLSWIGRTLFPSEIGDFHCGLRGFRKDAASRMRLQTSGMEFASEMVVKATLLDMKVCEVPTTLSKDGRSRPPHLRSWRDGWRHLRFLLIFSPRWLFLVPGVLLSLVGLLLLFATLTGPFRLGNVVLDVHTMLYGATMVAAGFQLIVFAVFVKAYGMATKLLPDDRRMERLFKVITLETGIVVGVVVGLVGLGLAIYAVLEWSARGLGPMDVGTTLRIVIPSSLLIMLGTQIVFSSFFLSVLGLQHTSISEAD